MITLPLASPYSLDPKITSLCQPGPISIWLLGLIFVGPSGLAGPDLLFLECLCYHANVTMKEARRVAGSVYQEDTSAGGRRMQAGGRSWRAEGTSHRRAGQAIEDTRQSETQRAVHKRVEGKVGRPKGGGLAGKQVEGKAGRSWRAEVRRPMDDRGVIGRRDRKQMGRRVEGSQAGGQMADSQAGRRLVVRLSTAHRQAGRWAECGQAGRWSKEEARGRKGAKEASSIGVNSRA